LCKVWLPMVNIYFLGDDPATAFAAKEFARYAHKVAKVELGVKRAQLFDDNLPGVWLGVCSEFDMPAAHRPWSRLSESRWDDGYAVKQEGDNLLIAGCNGRSVLFGVYAYFEMLGARWVRPGPRGELLPKLDGLPSEPLELTGAASYRHRGVCIEGAPSLEHALAMVDWMAKRRMNSFFLQFRNSGTFWQRWYTHPDNPYFGQAEALSDADVEAFDEKVIAEVKRRGLLLHRVGHGWTAAALGLPHDGWGTTDQDVAPDKRRWLAKVDGRRQLFHRTPINTELCYSHKPAFEAFVREVMTYAEAHPEADVLHVWLSDAMNNKCECPHCAPLSPADWYARLVNTLSERLYELDPQRRFVFLSYFESWWAPEQVDIAAERGNAILMFAPISRCYRHRLADERCADGSKLERPPLNATEMPRGNRTFVRLLEKWKRAYTGDSFLFDYHLWSGLHVQATDLALARIVHDDVRVLKKLGLNGIVSCQALRSFWPTGLAMAALAETAWNRKLRWRDVKQAHLRAAYGEHAAWVNDYLAGLESLLLGAARHGFERMESRTPKRLREIEAYLIDNHVEIIARADRTSEPVHRESLQILVHHNQFLLMRCQILLGKLAPADLKTWLQKSERTMHPHVDIPTLSSMQIHP
jgi:hypothetical protein